MKARPKPSGVPSPEPWRMRIIGALLAVASMVGGAVVMDKIRTDEAMRQRVQRTEDTGAKTTDVQNLERTMIAEIRRFEKELSDFRERIAKLPNSTIDWNEIRTRMLALEEEQKAFKDELRKITNSRP